MKELHALCSAFGRFGSRSKGHQSLGRPLPSADIAEHRASYTWALLGLCPQSAPHGTSRPESPGESLRVDIRALRVRVRTSKMIPLRTSLESTPTLRSSRHSLSNLSGVSLLSMLEEWEHTRRVSVTTKNKTVIFVFERHTMQRTTLVLAQSWLLANCLIGQFRGWLR